MQVYLLTGILDYPMVFSLIFKFSLIFMNMQIRYVSYRTIRCKGLSNFIIYDMKKSNGGLVVVLDRNMFIYGVLMIYASFLRFPLIFMNMQIRLFTYLAIG